MGKLQNEDFKTESELTGAGGAKTQLLNDTKVYVSAVGETLDDAITLGLIGGGGGINFISNSNAKFENNSVNDWLRYVDAAGTTPVDGTGGSPSANFNFSVTNSVPLNGTYSLLLSKVNSVNLQGQGFSLSSIAVPLAYRGQTLKLSFPYTIASGTYTSGDMEVWLYDQTNSELMIGDIQDLPATVVGTSAFFELYVPTKTNTASVRVILHQSTTTTNNYTIKVDDFTLAPAQDFRGVSAEDMRAYTSTQGTQGTQGFGTPSLVNLAYSRIGNIGIIHAKVTLGTVAAQEARVYLPDGWTTADSSIIPGIRVAGECFNSNTTTDEFWVLVQPGTTYLNFGRNGISAATANAIFNNGETISFTATVPLANQTMGVVYANSRVEYASNSGMGDAADTTSFVNDIRGNLVPQSSYTGNRDKRCRFRNAIQETDTIQLQVQPNGDGPWIDMPSRFSSGSNTFRSYGVENTTAYGIGQITRVSGSVTDIDVRFAQYRDTGATYGAAGSNWAADNTRWRVVKYSNALPVEVANHTYQESKNASASNFPTSGQYGDATSLVLAPGEYDLTGVVTCFGQVNTTAYEIGISTTSGNSNSGLSHAENRSRFVFAAANFDMTLTVPNYRVRVTTSTTYYLKVTATYSGSTPQYAYRFSARRIS